MCVVVVMLVVVGVGAVCLVGAMVSILAFHTGGAEFSPRKGSEFQSMIIARPRLDIHTRPCG